MIKQISISPFYRENPWCLLANKQLYSFLKIVKKVVFLFTHGIYSTMNMKMSKKAVLLYEN